MTGSQRWLLVILMQEAYADSSKRTRDPPDDSFGLRGLSVQAKR